MLKSLGFFYCFWFFLIKEIESKVCVIKYVVVENVGRFGVCNGLFRNMLWSMWKKRWIGKWIFFLLFSFFEKCVGALL